MIYFIVNLNKMFGKRTMDNVVGSVTGEVKFFGLTKTSMKLEGLDKHLRLIGSYKKLYQAREATEPLPTKVGRFGVAG